MFQEYNIYQYEYFKEIDSVCVVLCTDEPKYTDEDSHFIHIPRQLFIELTNKTNINSLCFEITNPTDPLTKIFIKKIEPSIGDLEKYIWLPNWICNKLKIQSFGDKINFVPIANPKEIKRIKIQGSSSSYVKSDIKKLLESKLEQFRCINLNENFHIGDVIFDVKELISKSDEKVRFGIISNEVEIDFEMPEDLKLLENKKKYIKSIINNKINQKIDERLDKNLKNNQNKTEKKKGIFNFSKLLDEKKLSENITNPNEIVNLDEILNEITIKINSQDNKFDKIENIPNPDNITLTDKDIQLITEIIEQGKNILSKMAEECKLNNNKCDDSCDSNIEKNKEKDNQNISNELFNSIPYKLNDSLEIEPKLSIEQIRKLRLEKFK